MNHTDSWYVAVDDVTAGPAPTDLVIRGIEHRKIPPEALVCPVGSGRWDALASIPVFHAAVVRSYPPPPPDSDDARRWMEQGFQFSQPAPLPQFEYPLQVAGDGEASDPEAVWVEPVEDGGLDVDWDDVFIDWREPFESYFLAGEDVDLPEEHALLQSLAASSRETFQDEVALWNLALCLAYGSDAVGAAAARTFFESVAQSNDADRVEWMNRTLLGNGFVPSGIPESAAQRAVERLRSSWPPSLAGGLRLS